MKLTKKQRELLAQAGCFGIGSNVSPERRAVLAYAQGPGWESPFMIPIVCKNVTSAYPIRTARKRHPVLGPIAILPANARSPAERKRISIFA